MKINRYPTTNNKSLRAWSAADEYLLHYLEEEKIHRENPLIYQDRFGYLSCHLHEHYPTVVSNYRSQEKAILLNIRQNILNEENIKLINPLSPISKKHQLVLLRIPKSLDLLKLYFQQISKALAPNGLVLASFMTKYFSPNILKIAEEYFEEVEQSRAWKKARLLILKKPKAYQERTMTNSLELEGGQILKQYYGVFSGKQIDIGTRFLIENLQIEKQKELQVLDLATGNGILGLAVQNLNPKAQLHLIDDNFLAVESAKINLPTAHLYYNDCLEDFGSNSMDYVISNPPFHFEYETNIEVSLKLFKEVHRVLKTAAHFQLVANKHLNYKTHLLKLFNSVEITKENNKFVLYYCQK